MGFSFGKSEQLFKNAMHPHPECEAYLKEAEQQGRLQSPEGSEEEDREIARNVSCKEADRELKAEAKASGLSTYGEDYRRRFYSLAANKYPAHVERWMNYRLRYEKIHEENLQALKEMAGKVVDGALDGLSMGVAWFSQQFDTGTDWALNWAFSRYNQAIAFLEPSENYPSVEVPQK